MNIYKKSKNKAEVFFQKEIAPGIYDMRLATEHAAGARPGQFVGVFIPSADRLLPRPISICESGTSMLRLIYRVTGRGSGTEVLSRCKKGDEIDIIGMLGNSFPYEKAAGKEVIIMGGGIGIPPLLETAKRIATDSDQAPASITAFLGYRDGNTFLAAEFEPYSEVVIASEDGSAGHRGNVIDAFRAEGRKLSDNTIIYACGPTPMLRAIGEFSDSCPDHHGTYLSLEERMACGVGACLGCVCQTAAIDEHSQVRNARVCTEGPVFEASEVVL